MEKNKKIIYWSMTTIIVLFSFLLFFGFSNIQKTPIQIVSFLFLVLSEIITFGLIYFPIDKKLSTFIKSGIITTSILFILLSFLINIIVKSMLSSIQVLITINLSMLLICAFLILVIFLFAKGEEKKNAKENL